MGRSVPVMARSVVVKSGANDWSGQMLTGGQVKAEPIGRSKLPAVRPYMSHRALAIPIKNASPASRWCESGTAAIFLYGGMYGTNKKPNNTLFLLNN